MQPNMVDPWKFFLKTIFFFLNVVSAKSEKMVLLEL